MKIAKLLIKNGANLNQASCERLTPLGAASCKGHIRMVELLLATDGIHINRINDNNQEEWGPLHIAVRKGHVEIIKLLLATQGIHLNEYLSFKGTPLHMALEKDHIEIIKLLINTSADVHAKYNDWTALLIASNDIRLNLCAYLSLLIQHI